MYAYLFGCLSTNFAVIVTLPYSTLFLSVFHVNINFFYISNIYLFKTFLTSSYLHQKQLVLNYQGTFLHNTTATENKVCSHHNSPQVPDTLSLLHRPCLSVPLNYQHSRLISQRNHLQANIINGPYETV